MGNSQDTVVLSEDEKAALARSLVATVFADQYTELAHDRQCYLSLLPKELFVSVILR